MLRNLGIGEYEEHELHGVMYEKMEENDEKVDQLNKDIKQVTLRIARKWRRYRNLRARKWRHHRS